jgi:hypothetical protein
VDDNSLDTLPKLIKTTELESVARLIDNSQLEEQTDSISNQEYVEVQIKHALE